MSHCINGYVVKKVAIVQDHLDAFPWVDLKQGYILILDPANIRDLHLSLSDAPIAHVWTDYFGGFGEQGATSALHGYIEEHKSINAALHRIGVDPEPGMDLFDAVGLGNWRGIDDIVRDWEKRQGKEEKEPQEEFVGRLHELEGKWYVDYLKRDGFSFVRELIPISMEDEAFRLMSDWRGRALRQNQSVKFTLDFVHTDHVDGGFEKIANIIWPERDEKYFERELRTNGDVLKLLEDLHEGKVLIDDAMGIIFLMLSKIHSEGFTKGWEAAEKRFKNGKDQ